MMIATLLVTATLADPQVVTEMSFKKAPQPSIEAPEIFPSKERIAEKRGELKTLQVEPVKPLIGYSEDEPPQWKDFGNLKINVASGAVKMQMKAGRLEPQIKELAAHLEDVQVDSDGNWFEWRASPHYRWPNTVEVHEPSVKHLVHALVSSAGLNIDVPKNGMVIIYE